MDYVIVMYTPEGSGLYAEGPFSQEKAAGYLDCWRANDLVHLFESTYILGVVEQKAYVYYADYLKEALGEAEFNRGDLAKLEYSLGNEEKPGGEEQFEVLIFRVSGKTGADHEREKEKDLHALVRHHIDQLLAALEELEEIRGEKE